jgi:hypothetical protein
LEAANSSNLLASTPQTHGITSHYSVSSDHNADVRTSHLNIQAVHYTSRSKLNVIKYSKKLQLVIHLKQNKMINKLISDALKQVTVDQE